MFPLTSNHAYVILKLLYFTDVQSSKKTTDTQMLPHRPMRGSSQRTTGSGSNLATTIHINSVMMRPKSAKKLFIKTNKNKVNQISVNFRPYSATVDANTAEKQQQRAETPPRRIKSGRTMHRTTWFGQMDRDIFVLFTSCVPQCAYSHVIFLTYGLCACI